jgi:DNA repair exonuclease SbcCD ATPase subunit
MIEQETFLNRIGRLFKKTPKSNGHGELALPSNESQPDGEGQSVLVETRGATVRSWGKNNAAISQLQEGFESLTELMGSIRQNLEAQGQRQAELIDHLSALPKVLEMIPESNRIQSETLKAMHQQLVSQAEQQQTLGDILEKLSEAGGEQKDILEGLRERVENLNHQDKAMADSLNTFGAAMESTSRNAATSAEVLSSLRDNIKARDSELERVLHRQGARFTTMLAIAIFLSIAALVAVVVMGYLMMHGGLPH